MPSFYGTSALKNLINSVKKRGSRVGEGVFIGANFYLDLGFERFLIVEDGAVISSNVSILFHDSAMNNICGLPVKFGRVVIAKNAYVGFNTTIMAGVRIGENSLVGANSLVTGDVPDGMLAYGSPARVVCSIEEYRQKFLDEMGSDSRFFYWDVLPWRERARKLSPAEEQSTFDDFIFRNRNGILPDAPSSLALGTVDSYRYTVGDWSDIDDGPPPIRWMGESARVYLRKDRIQGVFNIRCRGGDDGHLMIAFDRSAAGRFLLGRNAWSDLSVPVPEDYEGVVEVSLVADGMLPREGNARRVAVESVRFE
jgi:Acetyltransferase (isoleucine patch superfamily)